MPPFAIVGIFFREVGDCWLGPGVWNGECQGVPDLTLKSPIFWTLKKRFQGAPASLFHGCLSILGSFLRSFGGCFCQKHRNGKSVFGLRRRARIACPTFHKTILLGDFASHFLVFFQGPAFYTLFGRRGRQSHKNGPKKGATLAPCWDLFSKNGRTWGHRCPK